MNILITSAGRRVSLINAFKKELTKYFPKGKVYTVDMNPELSPACRVSDAFFSVPRVSDSNYCSIITQICVSNNIKILIPTIDTELFTLVNNYQELHDNGIEVIISSSKIIDICRDKRKTHLFFDSIGLPRAIDANVDSPDFPIFAKPYNGSCSIGIQLIKDEDDLNKARTKSDLMFLEYLSPLNHVEYTVDLYYDKNGILKCLVPRERIEVRGGEVSKGITRKDDIYNIVYKCFNKIEGFKGCITLQLFVNKNNGKYYGIEINPRFGGGYPLSYLAGGNFPDMIIREYLLNEKIDFFDNWKENLLMLRFDSEILVYDFKG